MNPEMKVDAAAFAAKFRSNLAKQRAEAKGEMPGDVKQQVLALMNVPAADAEPQALMGVDLGDFCANWPKYDAGFNRLMKYAGWLIPDALEMGIKAAWATFKEFLVPIACPAP